MSIFSKLLGKSDAQVRAEKLFQKAQQETEREYGPIGKLGMAIIQASTNCRDATKTLIAVPTENERIQREIFMFYEYIWFFMHMSMRQCFSLLNEEQMEKVQDYLGPLVSSVAIDSYCAHWPQERKDGMIHEFYENLNKTELEYAECTNQYAKGDVQGKILGLFMELATQVSTICGHSENDMEIVLPINKVAFGEWTKMTLPELVNDIKAAN